MIPMAPKNRRHRQEGRRQSASNDQRQALQLNQRVTFKQRPQRGERSEEQRGQLLVADIARGDQQEFSGRANQ
jgi:hypothetical protein